MKLNLFVVLFSLSLVSMAKGEDPSATYPKYNCQISFSRQTFDPNAISEPAPALQKLPSVVVTVFPRSVVLAYQIKTSSTVKITNQLYASLLAMYSPPEVYNKGMPNEAHSKGINTFTINFYSSDPDLLTTSTLYPDPRPVSGSSVQFDADATYVSFNSETLLATKPVSTGDQPAEDRISFGSVCHKL